MIGTCASCVTRISEVLAGEKLTDAASACAMCCAFAIVESAKEGVARGRMLAVMTEFMRKMVFEGRGQQP